MTLFQLAKQARKYVVQIIVLVVVCTAIATVVGFMLPRIYTSKTSVYITVRGEYDPGSSVAYIASGSGANSGNATATGGDADNDDKDVVEGESQGITGDSQNTATSGKEQDLVLLTSLASNVAQIAQSQSVADRVLRTFSISDVEKIPLEVAAISSNYLTVRVSWDSADIAAAMAGEVVKETAMIVDEIIGDVSLRIVDPASIPEEPTNAPWHRSALLGFCVGLIIAFFLLVLKFTIEERSRASKAM